MTADDYLAKHERARMLMCNMKDNGKWTTINGTVFHGHLLDMQTLGLVYEGPKFVYRLTSLGLAWVA